MKDDDNNSLHKKSSNSQKSMFGWYFLLVIILVYALVFFIDGSIFIKSLNYALKLFIRIIPVFILIYILLIIVNYFFKPKDFAKHMGKSSGLKGWAIAIVGGIISSGSIYMWYPLLNELQKYGVSNGLIAAFLYNRAIKLALLPLIIFYFGWVYTIVLTIVMIIASIVQGIVMNYLIPVNEVILDGKAS